MLRLRHTRHTGAMSVDKPKLVGYSAEVLNYQYFVAAG